MAGTELAKAYVQIIPSADGMKGKLEEILGKDIDPVGKDTGKKFGSSLASTIKKTIAAAGIGVVLKKAISEGANLEQSLGGIETLFKTSSDKVIANAKQAYMTAGLSANAYMESVTSFSASLLQGLAGDTNKAADIADMAMVDMSDNANKMGTDMQSIQNAYQGFAKQNYTMLDNLKLGYGGTKTEMERLLADAQKITGVKYDISNLSDVYSAIHVIQGELDITGTTAKEAATTLSGSFNSVKASFSNVLGSLAIGEDVKPALNGLIETSKTFLIENLLPMVKNIITGLLQSLPSLIKDGVPVILNALSEVASLLLTMLPEFLKTGTEIINQLIDGFVKGIPDLIKEGLPMLMSLSEELKNNASELIEAGINLLIELANGLIAGLPTMIETIPTIISNIANIINENAPKLIMAAGVLIWNLAKGLIDAIPTIIKELPKIVKAIFDVWSAINWINLGKNVVTAIKDGIKKLPELLKNIWANIKDGASNMWASIKTAILNPISSAKTALQTLINGVKTMLSGAWSGIKSVTASVWNGIKSAITNPIQTAKNVIKGVADAIKAMFKFSIALPHIKLPHFKISPSGWSMGDLLKGSIPKLGIDWYAKAMDNPMIMNSPTAFGINSLGQIMAGGDKGSEVVSGTQTLMNMIASAVASQNSSIEKRFENLLVILYKYLPQIANTQIVLDSGKLVGETATAYDEKFGNMRTQTARGW